MKKINIVTGAAGFLGNNLARLLTAEEEGEVRCLLLPGESEQPLAGLPVKIYRGDVTDAASLQPLFAETAGTDLTVYHCAALVYIKSPDNPAVRKVNCEGAKNVAEATLAAGGRLLYVSSVHALPEKPHGEAITEVDCFDPEAVVGLYAKTKAETANTLLRMHRERGLDVVIVHPSGIVGPNDFGRTHLTQLITDFVSGRLTACVKGGYDFVDVRDVAQGILLAADKGRAGECYLLSNRRYEIRELLDYVSEAAGFKKIKTVLPLWFAKGTARIAEFYYKVLRQPPLYTPYSLYTLEANANFCHEKASRELGYTTRPMEETVRDTYRWLKEAGRIKEKKKK